MLNSPALIKAAILMTAPLQQDGTLSAVCDKDVDWKPITLQTSVLESPIGSIHIVQTQSKKNTKVLDAKTIEFPASAVRIEYKAMHTPHSMRVICKDYSRCIKVSRSDGNSDEADKVDMRPTATLQCADTEKAAAMIEARSKTTSDPLTP